MTTRIYWRNLDPTKKEQQLARRRAWYRRPVNKKKCQKTSKNWIQEHPNVRYEVRKENYQKGAKYKKHHKTSWLISEMGLVINSDLTDRELAKRLGRTVVAIQSKRHWLKNWR